MGRCEAISRSVLTAVMNPNPGFKLKTSDSNRRLMSEFYGDPFLAVCVCPAAFCIERYCKRGLVERHTKLNILHFTFNLTTDRSKSHTRRLLSERLPWFLRD